MEQHPCLESICNMCQAFLTLKNFPVILSSDEEAILRPVHRSPVDKLTLDQLAHLVEPYDE